ncbi:tetraacyldisaccharide 4'-kinase [Desulfoluna butyratoxydans]|uniref:Tetraacyldisaccharide 4'-kinase n=2 Tax=Desulfoluna butyratoxydans TaxID=231438 RepID=A0A4U8YGR8_9BACT|nr:tetraacyldisaccharide 4'-kinase [Desulfoluna butyratoxydans]
MGIMTDYIERAFEDDGRTSPVSPKFALLGLSKVYGALGRAKRAAYEQGLLEAKRLPAKVVAIGNLTAGGTGKTPMTLFAARWFQQKGARVVIVSRGYGGSLSKRGAVVSDGDVVFLSPHEAGDEPVMMAEQLPGVPVVIGSDRYAAGMEACDRFRPDVVILDDAYQHIRLARDLNILLADGRRPFGNGHVLPRGSLREPLSALSWADAVVLTRAGQGDVHGFSDHLPEELRGMAASLPVLSSTHRATLVDGTGRPVTPDELGPVFLFSGIAKNHAVEEGAEKLGVTIAGRRFFGDHHPYTEAEIAALEEQARSCGASVLLTTDKDRVKVRSMASMPLATIMVSMDFNEDLPAVTSLLETLIRQ